MPPKTVNAILESISKHWPTDRTLEITLEANPTSTEASRFKAYAEAGVNRLSLGVQALNDSDLRRLGRNHDSREAMEALEIARSQFSKCNFDLIYARPGQNVVEWQKELSQALSLNPNHLSLYQLTIEKGTAFDGKIAAADPDLAADLFDATQEACLAAGLPAYEISNHAKLGQEGRHNLTYWRYGEYLGLGPGAHGRLLIDGQRIATSQRTSPERWLLAQQRTKEISLSIEERATEMVMMGMRLTQGLNKLDFLTEVGIPLENWLCKSGLDSLLEAGLISWQTDNLIASQDGRRVLNSIIVELLPRSIGPN